MMTRRQVFSGTISSPRQEPESPQRKSAALSAVASDDYSQYPGRIEGCVLFGLKHEVATWKVVIDGEDVSKRCKWVEPMTGIAKFYRARDGLPILEVRTPDNRQWHDCQPGERRIDTSKGEHLYDERIATEILTFDPGSITVTRWR